DPRTSDYGNLIQTATFFRETGGGSCILLLTRDRFDLPGDWPSFDAARSDPELIDLFRAVGGPESAGLPLNLVPQLSSHLAVGAANLGRLAGMAVRAGAGVGPAIQRLSQPANLIELERRAILALDLLAPFAACPPGWKLPDAGSRIWQRYFPTHLHGRV